MHRRALLYAGLALALPAGAFASEKKAEKKKGGGEAYIQLGAVTATTVRGDGRRGVLTVETGLNVPDKTLRARAEASAPRIRAAFVQIVQTYAAGLAPGAPPNADFLAGELQREADRVLGKPGARLLLGSILAN